MKDFFQCCPNNKRSFSSCLQSLCFNEENTLNHCKTQKQRASVLKTNAYDPQTSYWHGCAQLENICDSRQLPWSGAKVRLLLDFQVVTLVSWPLSHFQLSTGFIVDFLELLVHFLPILSLMNGCSSTYSVEVSWRPPARTTTQGPQ